MMFPSHSSHSSSSIILIHEPSTASGFMFACLKCYVACVRYRAKKYYVGQKRTTGGMNKTTVMEFFEACNALMAMPVCTIDLSILILLLRYPSPLQYCYYLPLITVVSNYSSRPYFIIPSYSHPFYFSG